MISALFAATLPGGDPSSAGGRAHLYAALITLCSLILIAVLIIAKREVPNVLEYASISGISYLFGTAIASRTP